MPQPPAYAVGQFRDAEAELERLRRQAAVLASSEEAAFRELGFPDAGRGADIGCGPGFVAGRFAASRPGLRLFGVDLDRRVLAVAGRLTPVVAAAATALPIASGALDFAYARLVLRYVADPARALREMVRITRPGGTVFVLDSDDGALVVHPHPEGFAEVLRARHQTLRRRGGDQAFARKLPGLLAEQDLVDVAGLTLTVSSLAVGPPAFAGLVLGPVAEAIDPDIMPRDEVEAAAAAIRGWTCSPAAFGMTTVVLVRGRRRPASGA